MNQVIELIEQKILDIENHPISTQEEEHHCIYELECLRRLLQLSKDLSSKSPI
jgi:hypothetical protein